MAESTTPRTDRDPEDRQRELRDIFVAATGSEEFTETQQQETTSRYIVAEEELSEPVTDVAKADGLTDTFGDLKYETDGG